MYTLTENDYDASIPQRHNDVEGAFVNDVYGDVNQKEGRSSFGISALHAI